MNPMAAARMRPTANALPDGNTIEVFDPTEATFKGLGVSDCPPSKTAA